MVRETKTGLMIEYYILDPQSEGYIRKHMRVEKLTKRLRTKREKMLCAHQIADKLNAKLRGGWSPLHQTEDARIYTRLEELQNKFLSAKKAEGCRESTLIQYKSVTDLWLRWCEDNGLSDRYSGTFLHAHAVRYMDDVLEQGRRHRSYNNTLKVLRAFFQWALEHLYSKENPC